MIRQNKKLSLRAESIRVLSDTALGRVNGGAGRCTMEQSGCATGTSGGQCNSMIDTQCNCDSKQGCTMGCPP